MVVVGSACYFILAWCVCKQKKQRLNRSLNNVTSCMVFLFESSDDMQTQFLIMQKGPVSYSRRILIDPCTDNIAKA